MVTCKSGAEKKKTRKAADEAAAGSLVEGNVGLDISRNIFPYPLRYFPRGSAIDRERHTWDPTADAVTDDGEQEAKARQRRRAGHRQWRV